MYDPNAAFAGEELSRADFSPCGMFRLGEPNTFESLYVVLLKKDLNLDKRAAPCLPPERKKVYCGLNLGGGAPYKGSITGVAHHHSPYGAWESP